MGRTRFAPLAAYVPSSHAYSLRHPFLNCLTAPIAKRLPMVSRHWLRELKGPMNRIVAEVGPMNFHQAMLEDAYNKVWTLRHEGGIV